MMLLPLLRPVSKGASRFLLAGTSASSVELKDLPNEHQQGLIAPVAPHAFAVGEFPSDGAGLNGNQGDPIETEGFSALCRKLSGGKRSATANPAQVLQQQQPEFACNTGAPLWQQPPTPHHVAFGAYSSATSQEPAVTPAAAVGLPGGTVLCPILWPVQALGPNGFGLSGPWPVGLVHAAPTGGACNGTEELYNGESLGFSSSAAWPAATPEPASSSARAPAPSVAEFAQAEQAAQTPCTTLTPSSSTTTTPSTGSTGASGASVASAVPSIELATGPAASSAVVQNISLVNQSATPGGGAQWATQTRTGASRRQRRRRRGFMATSAPLNGAALPTEVAAMRQAVEDARRAKGGTQATNEELVPKRSDSFLGKPAPVGFTHRSATPGGSSTRCESPVQLWPATPESTPPHTPRIAAPEVDEKGATDDVDAEELISKLTGGDGNSRQHAIDVVARSVWPLSCLPGGCRAVQTAIDVADGAGRKMLAENFQGRVQEAAASPHANHVLQKFVATLPSEQIKFMLEEMEGSAVTFARHRYGCRVLERLIEHCPRPDVEALVDEVMVGAEKLCRHAFGNFVVQHVLEHGTPSQQRQIADVLCGDAVRLAKHRVASHVVKAALAHCEREDKDRLVRSLSADPAELSDLAHHHCGSFVVRELRRVTIGAQGPPSTAT
mmetsp:Transcript_111949/g.316409  ORF Transcript_111949/g.316409 Transcript_111949/m.316409 type:complete len:669 (+) Transcript_111949:81-2087(+)